MNYETPDARVSVDCTTQAGEPVGGSARFKDGKHYAWAISLDGETVFFFAVQRGTVEGRRFTSPKRAAVLRAALAKVED